MVASGLPIRNGAQCADEIATMSLRLLSHHPLSDWARTSGKTPALDRPPHRETELKAGGRPSLRVHRWLWN